MHKKIVIAIDGYSGCGKSTTAKAVAQRLHYTYIDTGAMYRAVTYFFQENYVTLTDPRSVKQALDSIHLEFQDPQGTGRCDMFLNGLNVEEYIRQMRVSQQVSEVSTLAAVRSAMVAQQQKMGRRKGVVLDGRDIGTVVFPDAELKIFMTAEINVRAARRQQELLERGQMVALDQIVNNLQERDRIDSTRAVGPLKQAPDAHLIDTTKITIDEQVEIIINLANQVIDSQ